MTQQLDRPIAYPAFPGPHAGEAGAAQLPGQYRQAIALEGFLGDPADAENPFSYRRSVECDESDQYPDEACAMLDSWGLHRYYVPGPLGGRLESFEEILALLRSVARRDPTVAIAHAKTFLGAVSVWVGGSPQQQSRFSRLILQGRQIALGLTEAEHGSDVLAGQTQAVRTDGGYLLSGQKWLINNATRGAAMLVFARTGASGSPRGQSLFAVEKEKLPPGCHSLLPRVKTHGIRGADISGIRFEKAPLGEDSLVGPEGAGLEILLKGFQLTRALIPALSLGIADAALRMALDFALQRRLYSDTAFAIPQVQRTLVDAFLDILICDCLTTATARSIHASPRDLPVLSAVTKYWVPTQGEDILHSLASVLGARSFLRQGHCWGAFQKLLRDNAILSLFDGSTAVNLHWLALQLPRLARRRRGGHEEGRLQSNLKSVFDRRAPLDRFDPLRLVLDGRGRNSLLQGGADALKQVEKLGGQPGLDNQTLRRIVRRGEFLLQTLKMQEDLMESRLQHRDAEFPNSPQIFEMARRYCIVQAAFACLHSWLHNRELGGFLDGADWLDLCLERLCKPFDPAQPARDAASERVVTAQMMRLYQHNRLFALLPIPLAPDSPDCFKKGN